MTRSRLALVAVLALAGGLAGGYLLNTLLRLANLVADPASYSRTDFFAIWSYARLLLDQGAVAVYDQPTLFAAQVALGRDPAGVPPLPFAYPPHFLLLVAPLGLLPHGPAFGAWVAATLALYLAAACWRQRHGGLLALALLAAPTTSVVISFGQSGFLAGALLVGGLRLAPLRPVLAGVLLGLLTYKPQLGLLVPVVLLASRNWRCIAAATLCTLALAALSAALFGLGAWRAWIAVLPDYARLFDETRAGVLHYLPTVAASLLGAGLPAALASAGQAASGLAVAALAWRAWRADPQGAIAVPLAGTLLVASHGFIYDLPATTAGLLLFAFAHRPGPAGAAILLAALASPLLMFEQVVPVALNAVPGLAAFLFVARRYRSAGTPPAWGSGTGAGAAAAGMPHASR